MTSLVRTDSFSSTASTQSTGILPENFHQDDRDLSVKDIMDLHRDTYRKISHENWGENWGHEIKMSEKDIIHVFESYTNAFPPVLTEADLTFHEKHQFPIGTNIVFKTDLHGSFEDLKRLLVALRSRGFLTEDYKIVGNSLNKAPFKLCFLGDYSDRGANSFLVLVMVMLLKMENPDDIILLKGNHEKLSMMENYLWKDEKWILNNPRIKDGLEHFFSTLPSLVYIGCETKTEAGSEEFMQVSHGLFDPDIDPVECLESKEINGRVVISKDKKPVLSERIEKMINSKVLRSSVRGQSESHLLNVFRSKNRKRSPEIKMIKDNESIKRVKRKIGALSLKRFLEDHEPKIKLERSRGMTSDLWGDPAEEIDGPNLVRRGDGFQFTPRFVSDFFDTINTEKYQVKCLVRGHGHQQKEMSYKDRKKIVQTLPAPGSLAFWDSLTGKKDKSLFIHISGPEVSSWKAKELIQERGFERVVSEDVSMYESQPIISE